MRKLLVPVDGSDHSAKVARFLIGYAAECTTPLDIHLLNVQPPLPGTIRGVAEAAKQFHNETGTEALAGTRKLLDEAQVKYTWQISEGDPAQAIAQAIAENHCDHVVMGTRGMGNVRNMLIGSVATKVLHLVGVPVTLIKT